MSYGIAMTFISWMIMIIMVSGYSVVTTLKRELNNPNLDDDIKLITEAFLMPYFNSGFTGKVNFILLHGARFIVISFGNLIRKLK